MLSQPQLCSSLELLASFLCSLLNIVLRSWWRAILFSHLICINDLFSSLVYLFDLSPVTNKLWCNSTVVWARSKLVLNQLHRGLMMDLEPEKSRCVWLTTLLITHCKIQRMSQVYLTCLPNMLFIRSLFALFVFPYFLVPSFVILVL